MAHQDLCFTYMLFIEKNPAKCIICLRKLQTFAIGKKKKANFLVNSILIFVQLFRMNQKKIVYLPL